MSGTRRTGAACDAAFRFSGFRALTGLFKFALMSTRSKKPVERRAFGLSG